MLSSERKHTLSRMRRMQAAAWGEGRSLSKTAERASLPLCKCAGAVAEKTWDGSSFLVRQ